MFRIDGIYNRGQYKYKIRWKMYFFDTSQIYIRPTISIKWNSFFSYAIHSFFLSPLIRVKYSFILLLKVASIMSTYIPRITIPLCIWPILPQVKLPERVVLIIHNNGGGSRTRTAYIIFIPKSTETAENEFCRSLGINLNAEHFRSLYLLTCAFAFTGKNRFNMQIRVL